MELIDNIIGILNKMSSERGFSNELSIKYLETRQSKITFKESLDKLGVSHLNIMDTILKGDMHCFV
jgi:hypothetical protein